MYEKKLPFDISCGIKITMEIIGGKWKCCIIDRLSSRSLRPSELHRILKEATPRVIDQQLKELERHGIIQKVIYQEMPPRTEYFLTETGKSLLPLIAQIRTWGDEFRPEMKRILGISEDSEYKI